MKEKSKLQNAVDGIADRYLLEALDFGQSKRKAWKRWVAVAAAACLLIAGGLFAWKTLHVNDEINGDVWYVDAHTMLAGKSGGVPVEIAPGGKESNGKAELAQEDEANAGEEKPFVTLTWAYESFGIDYVSRDTVRELNRKLKEDGYRIGIKFLAIKAETGSDSGGKEYQEKLFQSKADIAFTGFYSSGERLVQDAIRAGEFAPLDEYLKESAYRDQVPEVLWKSVSYQGATYFFPNEFAQDAGLTLYLRKSSFAQEEADAFDGDLFSLERYFEEGKRFFECSADYSFAETFGYSDYFGVLLTEDGKAVNPLEEERCVRWLRILHDHQDQVVRSNSWDWDFALSRDFPGTGIGQGNQPEDFYTYTWKGYAVPRLNCQTGILASSQHKEEAFQFLELIRTDRSYAELLLYGSQNGEKKSSYAQQLTLGLDTGVKVAAGDFLKHFATAQEKKDYYEEWILPSPALQYQMPEACDHMLVSQDYKLKLIFTGDFDAMLKKAREKTKDPMAKVLRELR
ncbi:MAG: hypothetical protein K5678_01025 [Acetatifactor sp.]|nr:hypothetical protein [Acetatifactor sp.]